MKKIKKIRFNALAGYIRDFRTQSIGEEVGWYEKNDILGVIFFDYTDQLYNAIILGQDENLQFRWALLYIKVIVPGERHNFQDERGGFEIVELFKPSG